MRLELTRTSGPYGLPRSAVIAGAVLVSMGILAAALGRSTNGPVICPFRVVTGLPCPTCGLVRTVGLLLTGDLAAAFRLNPLDTVLVLTGAPLAAGVLVANRLGGWALRLRVGRRERAWLWTAAGVALVANWIYVLSSGV